jgi:UPF0755 protein
MLRQIAFCASGIETFLEGRLERECENVLPKKIRFWKSFMGAIFVILVGTFVFLSWTLATKPHASTGNSQRVTIPEGYNTEQIIALLVQKGIGSKEEFAKVITDDSFPYTFLKDAPKGSHRLEGYLFPNTYFIDTNTSPHAVIDMFLQQFAKELTPKVQKQLVTMKLSISQWVTLGSLVEKEAEKKSDRPLIASVLMNRLKIDQPLQIDATIQFLLGTPKAKLYDKDLQIASPYNTYLHQGLPPGPIANPGDALWIDDDHTIKNEV